jgi:SAM-dependent methyltransferase
MLFDPSKETRARAPKQVIGGCAKRIGMVCHRFMEITRRDGFGHAFNVGLGYVGRVFNPDKSEDDFDRAWKVNTSGRTNLWHTSIDSPNAKFGTAYTPSDPAWIEQTLAQLSEDFSTFSFIDLGCGKGRVLLLASNYGFRKVMGVEFAEELVKAARQNLRASGIVGAEVIHEDAANFHFPDGNLLIYLFNPFSAKILRPVLSHLAGRNVLQKTYLIYVNPLHASLVDATVGFRPIATIDDEVSARIWACP